VTIFASKQQESTEELRTNQMKSKTLAVIFCSLVVVSPVSAATYTVVGTGQTNCYSDVSPIEPPGQSAPYCGQDAQHPLPHPRYKDNGDGTVSDLNTELMWVKARGQMTSWEEAKSGAAGCNVGGYKDWRLPSLKELYSLINFDGGYRPQGGSIPYIDTNYFQFAYGDPKSGNREIDCQDWSATEYVGKTMLGADTVFGVNFADGRIKGYPKLLEPQKLGHKFYVMDLVDECWKECPHLQAANSSFDTKQYRKLLYVRYVRGNPSYGQNKLKDNGDGTITDLATELMWTKSDSRQGMNWRDALAWVQQKNAQKYLGHNDWRLPNAKELQSLVDYTRAPDATEPASRGPAIDPIFSTSKLPDNEYPFFWSSTTHLDGAEGNLGRAAVYVAFGRATGWVKIQGLAPKLLDVHGAGAQRSDPKCGNAADYPQGRGPQGDVIRIENYVRLVRNVRTVLE
jgi:hypothetical protein